MKHYRILLFLTITAAALSAAFNVDAQEKHSPDGTFLYASKDGQSLYLDEYAPSQGSETTLDGKDKPTIIYVFGGGFVNGSRDNAFDQAWFKMLNDEGYRVISIDYRLGLKGVKTKGGLSSVKLFYNAVRMASEDLFSATAYIIGNAETLKVNPKNLVICGSSAGAMTVLETDWMLSNGKASVELPDGFQYAGVMSFAGAILSRDGMPKYKNEPAPTAFFHGTNDKIVEYKKIHVLNWAFAGSDKLTKIFKKNGYTYNTLRYDGHTHEIASSMTDVFPEIIRFLETDVVKGEKRSIDSMIDDPAVRQPYGSGTRKELYSKD